MFCGRTFFTSNASRVACANVFDAIFILQLAGLPFQLLKLFARKNSRVAEKIRVIRVRRELKPGPSQSNVSVSEEENINPPSNLARENSPHKINNETKLSSSDESEVNVAGSQTQSPDVNMEESTVSPAKLQSGNKIKTTVTPSPSKNGSDVDTSGPPSQSQGGSDAVTTTKTPSPSKTGTREGGSNEETLVRELI